MIRADHVLTRRSRWNVFQVRWIHFSCPSGKDSIVKVRLLFTSFVRHALNGPIRFPHRNLSKCVTARATCRGVQSQSGVEKRISWPSFLCPKCFCRKKGRVHTKLDAATNSAGLCGGLASLTQNCGDQKVEWTSTAAVPQRVQMKMNSAVGLVRTQPNSCLHLLLLRLELFKTDLQEFGLEMSAIQPPCEVTQVKDVQQWI